MGLKIYNAVDPATAFSSDGTFSNPLSQSFNGITGEVIEKRYYVRNDDSAVWHSSITVKPVDGGEDIVDGTGPTAGFSWKFIAGDAQPLEAQWDLVTAGNTISLSDIGSAIDGDTRTYLPFWVRIEIPRGAPISSFQEVTLEISSTEGIAT